MSTQKCLQCEEDFKGRSDKKFCSIECRNEYNNARYKIDNTEIQRINKILKKNYQILKSLNPIDKKVVQKEKMYLAGFDFNYHTQLYHTKNGRTYFFCYDQGYLIDEEEKVLLVSRKE